MKPYKPILLALGALALPLSADLVGDDDFTYTDGPLAPQAGGNGWMWRSGTQDQTNGPATAWVDAAGTAPEIVSNALVTVGGDVHRQYGNNEVDGAFQGSGRFFYKVEMTRSATGEAFIAHDDFTNPTRVKFGTDATDDLPTIVMATADQPGENGTSKGTTPMSTGVPHTVVCVVDFDTNQVAMYVDPTASDYWTPAGANSADVTRTFNSGNWASRVRLGSTPSTTWDDLVVATTPAEVGLTDFVDADSDGLPKDWEDANGLDDTDDGTIGETVPGAKDGPNGALGNPDGDTLTNLQEFDGTGIAGFAGGTDPQLPDTDDDGRDDGDEVQVLPFTDPVDPDSDNDEIKDGEEVIAGVDTYITDPNAADTDGGGVNDGTEVAVGTNPTTGNGGDDPTSAGNLAFIGLEKFDYPDGPADGLNGGDGFDFDNLNTPETFVGHTGSPAPWDEIYGGPQIVCQRLRTQENQILRRFNGSSVGNVAGTAEHSGAIRAVPAGTNQIDSVFWVKVDMTRSSGAVWSGLSLLSYGDEKIFIGVPGALAGADELGFEAAGGGVNATTNEVLADGTTNTLVARIDQATGDVDIFLNPNLAGAEPVIATSNVFGTFPAVDLTAIRLASGGSGPTDWDNICLAATWAGLSTAPATDGGGLRDSFAAGFGIGGGAAGNDDSDSLTNLQEQNAGTSPILADTDSDGADDDEEVNGTTNPFPSPMATTDPCNPDSDGDGINDGPEIDGSGNTFDGTPTNPNLADTDGDGFTDPAEMSVGTNPNDSLSNPTAAGIIVIDGVRDPLYGSADSVQIVNSTFNLNELDAGYTYVKDGKLYLMVTGNLEGNFNKISVFFDSNDNVTSTTFTSAGNDNSGNMNGLIFDSAFSPDYHVIVRRGFDGSTNKFDLDIAQLGGSADSNFYGSLFGDAQEGVGSTGTGTVNAMPITVAYDDSNTAGIIFDGAASAANQVDAAAVTTGLELCIDLGDLGNPGGSLKVGVLLNNADHNFCSNQFLGGLPVGVGNLGTLTDKNLDLNYGGDQFWTVTLPSVSNLALEVDSFDTGTNMIMFNLTGIEAGKTYSIFKGASPEAAATDTTVDVTDATSQPFAVPADEAVDPVQFFQAKED